MSSVLNAEKLDNKIYSFMLTKEELLKLVEYLTVSAEEFPEKQINADKTLLAIYRAVHSHRRDVCCKSVHDDWRKEAMNAFNELKKLGEI